MCARLFAVILALPCALGCAGSIARDMATEVPEPLINESLRTVLTPDTRELVTDVAALPEIEQATASLVASVTDGTLEALDDEERAERIGQAVEGFVRQVGHTLADVVGREIAPSLSRSVAAGLERALVRLTAEPNRERLAELARTLGHAGAEQLVRGVHVALQDPEVQQTVALTARNVGYQLALGAGDAIHEIEARERAARPAAPGGSSAPAALEAEEGGLPWAAIAAAVLAALLVIVVVASRIEARRRERALVALTDALEDAEDRPWAGELRALVRRRLREDARSHRAGLVGAASLRDLFRRRTERGDIDGGDEPRGPRRLDGAEAS